MCSESSQRIEAALLADPLLSAKYARLRGIMISLKRVAVAFSAGVDSTLVLKVALNTLGRENVLAVTGSSASLASAEFEQTRALAEQLGAEHEVIETTEFQNESYVSNPTNRCYFCKSTLYDAMSDLIAERGIRAIVNGANADDLDDYRPGMTAAAERNIHAPLAEAELTKQDVRMLSELLGLPTFDKPASPCLSSRVQYGERITPEKLLMIEEAEAFLKSLGFRECRVRHHDNLARVEVHSEDIGRLAEPALRQRVDRQFRELGYHYVTVDLRGFRSGSMNEMIQLTVSSQGENIHVSD